MVLWIKESSKADACYMNLLGETEQEHSEYKTMKLESKGSTNKDHDKSTELRMQGNQQFQAQKWREAMQLYDKSLCFAPSGSENIGLAYANRSACFLHMEMYDECLIDIDLAKAANYPERLMHKLDERQATCLQLLKTTHQHNEIKDAALSYAPNEQFPSLANVLRIQNNDEFGKHIVATQDIDVGQIVSLEDAFVHGANQTDQICCRTCLRTKKNFIPCRNCTEHMFCDVDCMESNALHELMCGIPFEGINEIEILTAESILLAVIAIPNAESLMEFVENALATRDFDTPECVTEVQAKYRLFLKLFVVPMKLSQAKITIVYRKLLEVPQIRRCFQSKRAKRFLMHLIWQHFCIIQTNGLSFEIGEHGAGNWQDVWMVANCFSLFNHSCYPNALHQIQGNQLFICTVRPIKSGEQLFIKYFRMKNQDEIKFQETDLTQNFQFQCKCSKCIPCCQQADCMRIQMDPDLLFINNNDASCFADSEKRAVLKGMMLKFLNTADCHGQTKWKEL